MPLTPDQRAALLAEPHVGALSVAEDNGRAPLTVPIWYKYEPGGELWVLAGPDSRKAKAIQRAGRFTMLVQDPAARVRYVSVEGPVTRMEAATDEQVREMAARYLPEEELDGWVEYSRTVLGPKVAIFLRPEHWLSQDLTG